MCVCVCVCVCITTQASGAAVLSVGEPVVAAAATPEEQGTKKKASLIPEYTLKEEVCVCPCTGRYIVCLQFSADCNW